MEPLFTTVFQILYVICDLLVWLLVISAVLSWLIAFNVLNTRNQLVYVVSDALYRFTEPMLRPIRRRLPVMSGLDLSPIVLILALIFIQLLLKNYGLV